jgi:hypothetical protein
MYGLEKEFFLVDEQNKPQAILGPLQALPKDECGWLVEARGSPFSSIVEAVFSLKAAIHEIELKLEVINKNNNTKFKLIDAPLMKIDKNTRAEVARHYGKPPVQQQNFYGHQYHRNNALEATAGVHVSMTKQMYIHCKETQHVYNTNFDWPRVFVALDKEFKEEISKAKRNPGFYELKEDGRVEHRSLPANVDLDKLIKVIRKTEI